jgi:hypothetical protein
VIQQRILLLRREFSKLGDIFFRIPQFILVFLDPPVKAAKGAPDNIQRSISILQVEPVMFATGF